MFCESLTITPPTLKLSANKEGEFSANVALVGGLGVHTITVKPLEREQLKECQFEVNLLANNVPIKASVVAGRSIEARNLTGVALDLVSFQLIGEDNNPVADPRSQLSFSLRLFPANWPFPSLVNSAST